MFATIKRLYDAGRLSVTGVANAVVKGWITAQEYKDITGNDYTEG